MGFSISTTAVLRKRACAFDPRVAGPNPASPLVLASGWAGLGGCFAAAQRPLRGRAAAVMWPFCGRAAAAAQPQNPHYTPNYFQT